MKSEILNEEFSSGDCKLRPIACELNPLTRTDGSAIFSQGETCVLVSTIGPVESKLQHFKIEEAHVECIYRPKIGLPTIHDKWRQNLIRDTCESALITTLFPRNTISIQVQELDDGCGLDACALNASCMALLISGLPMEFSFAAVYCIVDRDDELRLDPDQLQEIGHKAEFTFVYDSLKHNIVSVNTRGVYSVGQLYDAEQMCRVASDIIFKFYRKILTKFHLKTSEEKPMEVDSESKTETIET